MNERFYCMDCRSFAPLDAHGRCATCESESVVSEHRPVPTFDAREIVELNRIFAL